MSLTAFADQSVDLVDLNPENIFENTATKATPSDAEKKQKNEYEITTGSNADISDETKDDRKNESKYDKNDKIDTTKIYDFIWQDPEEYLNDGRLELSAAAEEQPTFEQIVSILPQSILAKTGETAENTSADEAEDESEDITADYDVEIEVSGWQCADYIQNEEGMWPTSGSFTFSAEPQSGMKRGWIFVNGKWYYLNANTDGKGGIMLANCLTPDGYYVKEDGSWDGTDRR